MAYTPINTPVYLRAFAGCLAGLGARAGHALVPSDNLELVEAADAYARQVDLTWAFDGDGEPSQFALEVIEGSSSAVWQGRSPLESSHASLPESYAGIAAGVVATVVEADAQLAANGVDPNQTGANVALGAAAITPASPVSQVLRGLALSDWILRTVIVVTSPFDGLARLRVRTASGTVILGPTEVPLSIVAQYAQNEELQITGPDSLVLEFTRGGATTGQAYVTYLVGQA